MSRIMMALGIFGAVALAILIPLGLVESRRTPDWQSELNRYLQITGIAAEEIQRVAVAQAQHPERLTSPLLNAVPTNWTWEGIERNPPPEGVQCIRLARRKDEAPLTHYLFLGYHDDGQWHAGWLVHLFREGVSEGEQQALLERLGCTHWAELSPSTLSAPTRSPLPRRVSEPDARVE